MVSFGSVGSVSNGSVSNMLILEIGKNMILGEIIFIILFVFLIGKYVVKKLNLFVLRTLFVIGIINLFLSLTMLFIKDLKAFESLLIASLAFLSFSFAQFRKSG